MSNDHSHKRGQSALTAKGLVKRFKTGRTFIEVLKGVDFDAKHGDVTMVMGPSGSGKSTQLPQYLLEVMSETGRAVITEPRAIAVESVANRVSAVHSN